MCVRACVRTCVRAYVRACVRPRARARVCVCVCVFAYRAKRSVGDAVLYVLNSIEYAHLDKPNASVRVMFFDVSIAFSTIRCHLMAHKLLK